MKSDDEGLAAVSSVHILAAIILGLLAACFFCSCSSISPVYDANGHFVSVNSSKFPFGPDLEYEHEWDELALDGKTVLHFREKVATHTTADRIASVLGSLLEGWDKLKP